MKVKNIKGLVFDDYNNNIYEELYINDRLIYFYGEFEYSIERISKKMRVKEEYIRKILNKFNML